VRDEFPRKVLKELANRAGNSCSNPDCQRPTSGPTSEADGVVSIGVGAHITAAGPGGPRYDPALTSDQRCSSANGIWLCQTCSRSIDRDLTKYTKELLLGWKISAELRARSLIETPELPTGRNEPTLNLPETDPTISRLAFSARATKFVGRKEDQNALARFLASEAKFVWWLATGPGGTGKSRLALECCLERRPSWYAGFLSKTEQFKDWRRYRPTRPTLIVMDYVASRAADAADIILQLSRSSAYFPFPVRVLLLERDQGSWWSEVLRDDSQSESAEIRACLFDQESLKLKGLTPEQLSAVAQDVCQAVGKPWTPSAEREFRYRMHTLDPLNRPLFGMMAALYLGMGTADAELNTSLLGEVMKKELRRRRGAVPDTQTLRLLENLMTLATLVGGLLPQGGGFDFATGTTAAKFLPNMTLLDFELYRDLVSAPSAESSLSGLQPDIIGERFVLDRIATLDPLDSTFKHLLLAAWLLQGAGLCDFIVRAASDFPEDPKLPTLCDLPLDTLQMRFRWGRLVAELVRVTSASDSPLCEPLLSKLRKLADSYESETGLRAECARAELYLGNIFMFVEGNAKAALAQFEATIRRAGSGSDMEASAINNRGILHAQMREADKAFQNWTDVIESKGASDEVRACSFNNRADVFVERGEHAKAIEDRSSVLALKKTSPDRRYIALMRRSKSLLATNQMDKALEDLAALLATVDIASAQKAEALVQRGNVYASRDERSKAQLDFAEVLALDELFCGTVEKALVGLAELARFDGDAERAGRYLREALSSAEIGEDTFIEGLIVEARLLMDTGQTAEAEGAWRTIAADPRATFEQRAVAKAASTAFTIYGSTTPKAPARPTPR
jgi:tetratricopeptide (TPR) repeat protein